MTRSQIAADRCRNAIRRDIHARIRIALSTASEDLAGIAPCPYAREALDRGRVRIAVGASVETLHREIRRFNPDRHDVVVWACPQPEDLDRFDTRVNRLNCLLARHDLHLLRSHPEYAQEDSGPEVPVHESACPDYTMVMIQSLSKLNTASAQLERCGYYDNYTQDQWSLIEDRRNLQETDHTVSD